MTPTQVIRHFGDERTAAYKLGITTEAIKQWKKKKIIPRMTQHAIAHITNDALTVDEKFIVVD